jgi:hypothetical protein
LDSPASAEALYWQSLNALVSPRVRFDTGPQQSSTRHISQSKEESDPSLHESPSQSIPLHRSSYSGERSLPDAGERYRNSQQAGVLRQARSIRHPVQHGDWKEHQADHLASASASERAGPPRVVLLGNPVSSRPSTMQL